MYSEFFHVVVVILLLLPLSQFFRALARKPMNASTHGYPTTRSFSRIPYQNVSYQYLNVVQWDQPFTRSYSVEEPRTWQQDSVCFQCTLNFQPLN